MKTDNIALGIAAGLALVASVVTWHFEYQRWSNQRHVVEFKLGGRVIGSTVTTNAAQLERALSSVAGGSQISPMVYLNNPTNYEKYHSRLPSGN